MICMSGLYRPRVRKGARVMDGLCIIYGAGEYFGNEFALPGRDDFVIAADGGFDIVSGHGIRPDLVVGDFDSLGKRPEGDNVLCFPVLKDETDMMIAVKEGFSRGFGKFRLYGGTGGRLDHTLGNIRLLLYIANRGGEGIMTGNGYAVTAVRNSSILFNAENKGYLSIFALSDPARGVTLKGLKFPLENAVLDCDVTLGVSNEFIGRKACVSVDDGALAVLWECSGDIVAPEFIHHEIA